MSGNGLWRSGLLTVLLLASSAGQAAIKIQHWVLENGARVYFVEARELPMLQVRAVFDGAGSRDPKGRSGLAHFTSLMLKEGAGDLTADDIAGRFESLGAEFGASAERDMVTVDLRSLTDPALLEPAVELFAKVLARPTFPQASLERERARLLVALQKDAQSPGAVIHKEFMRQLYGDHPYARDPLGDKAGLKAIRRGDLVTHHERFYVGANVWLVLVGDVGTPEAQRLARRLVGHLPRGAPPPPLPAPTDRVQPRLKRIAFPATQSHIRLGGPGITRLDPDYFPLYVGNYILGGGGLVSRLSEELREKHGLSYSAYSYFMPMRVDGPFVLGLQTRNAQREQALRLMRAVLEEFIVRGPTDRELKAAKQHITGGFPLRLDSNRKIADNLAVIAFYGLPLTYLDDFSARVEAVTAQQIRDAFRRRVHPRQMITVILGGRS
jgi:zinc protease